jgi:hypothetical protein
MEKVLDIVAESEPKDFEFIMEIEKEIASVLRRIGRDAEADEIDRRLESISEVIDE